MANLEHVGANLRGPFSSGRGKRYDLELRDFEGIVDWLNTYRPHPDGKLYIQDRRLILPGDQPIAIPRP